VSLNPSFKDILGSKPSNRFAFDVSTILKGIAVGLEESNTILASV
jgi:hypothetical protein